MEPVEQSSVIGLSGQAYPLPPSEDWPKRHLDMSTPDTSSRNQHSGLPSGRSVFFCVEPISVEKALIPHEGGGLPRALLEVAKSFRGALLSIFTKNRENASEPAPREKAINQANSR